MNWRDLSNLSCSGQNQWFVLHSGQDLLDESNFGGEFISTWSPEAVYGEACKETKRLAWMQGGRKMKKGILTLR